MSYHWSPNLLHNREKRVFMLPVSCRRVCLHWHCILSWFGLLLLCGVVLRHHARLLKKYSAAALLDCWNSSCALRSVTSVL
jgi:hypothetical protein